MKMKKCNTKDVKRRSRELTKHHLSVSRFDAFLNTEDLVIFAEIEDRKG